MTDATFVIEPPAITSLPVVGESRRFPVARVYCVGRNYAEHAREMGHNPDAEPPFFFMKPATALVADGGDFPYPGISTDVHHEVEFVVAIGQGGSNIAEADALSHVYGYAVGLDMTRRDLQAVAKKAGRPWEVAKAFDRSAPCGPIVPAAGLGHPATGAITLTVNGEVRQSGDLSELIWNVPATIAYLSTLFELRAGDLIFTGTPSGVASVQRGDRLVASVASVGELAVTVV
ncbi:FAA hydrolase family protein [Xylophilus sp. Kf1]|nr:FAA hydrolase family protein [Xylophilus sp. Kf1]